MQWFRHDTNSLRNRKIRKAIRSHGAVAYAIYFALLEYIYLEEGEFQVLADELWLESLADDLKISDYRVLVRVLDTFAEAGLIDKQMWEGEHAIFIEAVVERGDAYLEKRLKEAEKKRRQRAAKKELKQAQKETMSPGDNLGQQDKPVKCPPQIQIHSHTQIQASEEQLIKERESGPGPQKQMTLVDGTVRNPCLAPAVPQKPTKSKSSFDGQAWMDTYNKYKPMNWSRCDTVKSEPRKKSIKAAIQSCADEQQALETFAIALSWVRVGGAKTKFWREKCNNPCFETLLRPTTLRFLGLAEEGASANINPEAISASGFSDDDIKRARREKHIKEAMQRWS